MNLLRWLKKSWRLIYKMASNADTNKQTNKQTKKKRTLPWRKFTRNKIHTYWHILRVIFRSILCVNRMKNHLIPLIKRLKATWLDSGICWRRWQRHLFIVCSRFFYDNPMKLYIVVFVIIFEVISFYAALASGIILVSMTFH